jgi:hypothetical protein
MNDQERLFLTVTMISVTAILIVASVCLFAIETVAMQSKRLQITIVDEADNIA